MSTAFLVVAVILLLGTMNAWFPTRATPLLAVSFMWSWLVIELAPWVLVWHAIFVAFFAWGGALDDTAGRIAFALTMASAVGVLGLVILARRTVVIVGGAIRDLDVDGAAPPFPPSHVWFPFLMRHRDGIKLTRDVVFGEAGGTSLRLDVTEPAAPGELRPGLLHVHGGAWVIGDKRQQGIPLANHMAANGWVVLNANYRLCSMKRPPTNPTTLTDQVEDVKRAIAWYREHAAEHGADPDFLCITGGSAGGHLTALVTLTADDPRYQPGFEDVSTALRAAVPFYGVYDFTNRYGTWPKRTVHKFFGPVVLHRRFEDDRAAFVAASPLDQLRADAPPFFVIHGSRDTLTPVQDARVFARDLSGVSGAPVLYAEMIGAQHAFDVFPSFRTASVVEGVERFLHSVHRAYRAGRTDDEVTEAEVGAPLVDAPAN